MKIDYKEQIPLSTLRTAMIVMSICYLPHIAFEPWWLNLIALAAVTYRLLASFYNLPMVNNLIRILLTLLCLFFLKNKYHTLLSNQLYISFLLCFFWLKIIEVSKARDLKVLALCNFYVIFTALIHTMTLWVFGYLFIALFANLSLMLKLSAPTASLFKLSRNSLKQCLAAIPISLLFFFLFPRLGTPLWQVHLNNQGKIGFSEKVQPGSLSQLFYDDRLVMRIVINNQQHISRYWRGLVLAKFDGLSWQAAKVPITSYQILPAINSNQPANYQIMLEPQNSKWLFYTDRPMASNDDLLFFTGSGLMRKNGKAISHKYSYELLSAQVVVEKLSRQQQHKYTWLPKQATPQLKAWAKDSFKSVDYKIPLFIRYIKNHIKQQPYWYKLSPRAIGNDYLQMDRFWFQTKEGYCEHYASAVAIILRAVGIPTRMIVGYQGGTWNPYAKYLSIYQNNAHAWLEYWQPHKGWLRLDPTAFIAQQRIDKTIQNWQASERENSYYSLNQSLSGLSIFSKLGFYLESLEFFGEKWLLFYNKESQQSLLNKLYLSSWNWIDFIKLSFFSLVLFIVSIWVSTKAFRYLKRDKLQHEYHLLRQKLSQIGIEWKYSDPFAQLMDTVSDKFPTIKPDIQNYIKQYEMLRLKPNITKTNEAAVIELLKTIRRSLNKLNAR